MAYVVTNPQSVEKAKDLPTFKVEERLTEILRDAEDLQNEAECFASSAQDLFGDLKKVQEDAPGKSDALEAVLDSARDLLNAADSVEDAANSLTYGLDEAVNPAN